MGVWIETYGWELDTTVSMSHPAWVCGLKLRFFVYNIFYHLGHTLRGCVDWNFGAVGVVVLRLVTPCVGVWIETHAFQTFLLTFHSHTLRGCVDWNLMSFEVKTTPHCHTLRGCVDWNYTNSRVKFPTISHTLRGCVDWNKLLFMEASPLPGHTLRGCVDWNYVIVC